MVAVIVWSPIIDSCLPFMPGLDSWRTPCGCTALVQQMNKNGIIMNSYVAGWRQEKINLYERNYSV
ncbi:hypothetical protein D1872_346830 [compost metagenome]